MADVATVPVQAPAAGDDHPLARRDRPSWFDRLKGRVEQVPGPAWLVYLGGAGALVGLRTLLQWSEGASPVGTLDLSLLFTSVWPWYALAAMHYLDRAAGRALDDLRPLLSGTAETQQALRDHLTTMPARPALAASLGAVLLAVLVFLATARDTILVHLVDQHIAQAYGRGTSPLVLGLTLGALWLVGGLFVYHTLRQLRLVRMITTQVAGWQLTPLYRMSRVTAATAAAWSGGLSLGLLTFTLPQVGADPVALALVLGVSVLAGVTFVWPLLGIHGMLETEKTRLQRDAQDRLHAALSELQRRQDRADYAGMGAMNDALSALLTQQAVVEKMATWPWRSGTIGALATALVLPLVLWFLTRLLAQWIP